MRLGSDSHRWFELSIDRPLQAVSAGLSAGLLIVACSQGTTNSFQVEVAERNGVAFPTFPRGEGGPLALIEGTLIEANGCLWIESGALKYVIVWPSGFDLVGTDGAITVVGDGQTFHLGDPIATGGGAYDVSALSVTGVENLSAGCAAASWWLATHPAKSTTDP